MKNINLGAVRIPVDDYASQGNAILGIRDSGKSYTATAIGEQLMDAGIPILVIDPIGIWRNLRVPGEGKGYEVVVAGGKAGDLPLTPRGVQEIVRAAMREQVSLVLDLYDIHLSKADWREVVANAIRTLLYENGEHGLRHVFIEEAAEFVPQNVGPEQGRVYAEVEKLARMGGNALLGYTLINQRAEQVNKAVLELCDCLILHRQKGRNSLNALSKWLDIASAHDGKALIQSLPGLAQGECWVWPGGTDAPTRTRIQKKRSFHPDRRARQGATPAERKAVDVSKFVTTMRVSLAAMIREAEENDPKKLLRENAQLRARLGSLPATAVAAEQLDAAHTRGHKEGFDAGLMKANAVLSSAIEHGQEVVADAVAEVRAMIVKGLVSPAMIGTPMALKAVHRPLIITGKTDALIGKSGLKRMLVALAQRNGLTKRQLGVRAGLSSRGGTFDTYLSKARTNGWVEGTADALSITAAGIAALGSYEPLPEGTDLLAYWLAELGSSGAARMLQALRNHYPKAVDRVTLGVDAKLAQGGTFDTYLSRLRTLELVTGSPGALRMSDELAD